MSELQRFEMIQACIDVIKKRKQKVNYLEIGVQTGFCFFMIKAGIKLAVDPRFSIKAENKIKAYIRNPSNFNNKFFEQTSDAFFDTQRQYLQKIGGVDVVFIDGLHLYEQVVKDIENSLQYLNNGGVILVHDCNPANESSAVRAHSESEVAAMNLPGYNHIWNGDVWRAIVEIRINRQDIDVCVIDSDQGVGIITENPAEKTISLTPRQLAALTYADLDKNRAYYLNLKAPEYFSVFINELKKFK